VQHSGTSKKTPVGLQNDGALAIALFWTWHFAPLLCQDKSGKTFFRKSIGASHKFTAYHSILGFNIPKVI
jgi:hypothetical protein